MGVFFENEMFSARANYTYRTAYLLNLNDPTLTYYQSATAPTTFYDNGAQYYLNLRFEF